MQRHHLPHFSFLILLVVIVCVRSQETTKTQGDDKSAIQSVVALYQATEDAMNAQVEPSDDTLKKLKSEIATIQDKIIEAESNLEQLTKKRGMPQEEVSLCQKIVQAKERRGKAIAKVSTLLGKLATETEAHKHMLRDDDFYHIKTTMKTIASANTRMQEEDHIPEECQAAATKLQKFRVANPPMPDEVEEEIKNTESAIAKYRADLELKKARASAVQNQVDTRRHSFQTKLETLHSLLDTLQNTQ